MFKQLDVSEWLVDEYVADVA